MNLWQLFPSWLVKIDYILYLPYAAMVAYTYAFYALVAHKKYRGNIALFILLSIIATGTMVLTLGPGIGKVVPPLLLLLVMFFPVIAVLKNVIRQDKKGTSIWLTISIAGWLHSLSWVVWLFALARS